MEILDGGPDNDDLSGRTLQDAPGADLVADLDADLEAARSGAAAARPAGPGTRPVPLGASAPGEPGAGQPGAGQPVEAGFGPRRVLATVLAPETLGLASLVMVIVGLTGGFQVVLMLNGGGIAVQSPSQYTQDYANGVAVFAVPCLAMALGAMLRLRPGQPRWVGAVAGAALILSTLLLLLVGFGLWHASGLPTAPQGFVGG
jgi:hypothetical protein